MIVFKIYSDLRFTVKDSNSPYLNFGSLIGPQNIHIIKGDNINLCGEIPIYWASSEDLDKKSIRDMINEFENNLDKNIEDIEDLILIREHKSIDTEEELKESQEIVKKYKQAIEKIKRNYCLDF